MGGYFKILAAIPGFFLSSFILMLLWGVIAPQIMWKRLIMYSPCWLRLLWLAVAPLAAVGKHHWH